MPPSASAANFRQSGARVAFASTAATCAAASPSWIAASFSAAFCASPAARLQVRDQRLDRGSRRRFVLGRRLPERPEVVELLLRRLREERRVRLLASLRTCPCRRRPGATARRRTLKNSHISCLDLGREPVPRVRDLGVGEVHVAVLHQHRGRAVVSDADDVVVRAVVEVDARQRVLRRLSPDPPPPPAIGEIAAQRCAYCGPKCHVPNPPIEWPVR